MVVSKEHAVKIAQKFVQERLSECPVRLDSPFARREAIRDRCGWTVVFDRITPPDVVMSPGEVIVWVDETTGRAEFGLPI